MSRGATRRGVLTAVVVLATCCCPLSSAAAALPSSATASPRLASTSSTTLTAGFSPNTLGAASTMELGFRIHRSAGETPSPLIDAKFRLPAGVSLSTSELGQSSCTPATLAGAGAGGCETDAVMGYGKASIFTPDAAEAVLEPAGITVLMGPAENRHTTLLFYASGDSPVIAQLLFSAQLIEDSAPFGADLDTTIPLTAGLPGEPDAAVVSLSSTIGSKGVTYYKSVHGARVAYTPKGVVVPSQCPAGGFPFGATFRFANGSTESVSITSPCPQHGGHAHSRRGEPR